MDTGSKTDPANSSGQSERKKDTHTGRFRRQSRLTGAAAFSRVFKNARRSRDSLFTVLYRDNDEDEARLGLAISKKHCRLAVRRNRIKRIVRESFRQHRVNLEGLDIVVLNQPGTDKASNKALFDSLSRHWRRTANRAGKQ